MPDPGRAGEISRQPHRVRGWTSGMFDADCALDAGNGLWGCSAGDFMMNQGGQGGLQEMPSSIQGTGA